MCGLHEPKEANVLEFRAPVFVRAGAMGSTWAAGSTPVQRDTTFDTPRPVGLVFRRMALPSFSSIHTFLKQKGGEALVVPRYSTVSQSGSPSENLRKRAS